MSKNKNIFKDTVIFVFFLSMIAKILGLIKDLIFSWAWGVSKTSDAYFIASTIPTYLTMMITTGITTCFLPIYISLKHEKEEKISFEYCSKIITAVTLICVAIILFSLIFTKQIVNIFAHGFDSATMSLTIYLTRITIFETFTISIVSILSGILQVEKKYYWVLISNLILQLFYCMGSFISSKTSISILAFFGLIGCFFQILILYFISRKNGFKYKYQKNFFDKDVRHTLALIVPVIISSSASEISKIIDKTLASISQVGGVTILNYANKIDDTIITIFTTSIVTIAYPLIVKSINNMKNKKNESNLLVSEYLILLMLLIIPISIGAIVYSKNIIQLIFLRGAFSYEYLEPTSRAFSAYAMGITFFTIRKYVSRIFYAFHETKIPTINSIITILLNIIFSIILSKKLGITGIALGTSISAFFSSFNLILILNKKKLKLNFKYIFTYIAKIIIFSAISIFLSYLVYSLFNRIINENIAFIICTIFAIIVYIILIFSFDLKKYLLLLRK